jgi:hypothetical protein
MHVGFALEQGVNTCDSELGAIWTSTLSRQLCWARRCAAWRAAHYQGGHTLEVQEERCPCEPVQESNTLYAGLGFELCSIRISWETAV